VRRSALALVSAAALFVLAQVCFHWLAWRLSLRDAEYASRLADLREQIEASSEPPLTVLLLGTSRSQWGVRSRLLAEQLSQQTGRRVVVGNFSMGGASPVRFLFWWERLRRQGVRPDLVLLEVLPMQLGRDDEDGDFSETMVPTRSLYWQDLSFVERFAGAARRGVRLAWLRQALLPCHSDRIALLRKMAPSLLSAEQAVEQDPLLRGSAGAAPGETNFTSEVTAETRARMVGLSREGYRHRLAALEFKERPRRALRELLESCRQEGAATALLLAPEGPTFRTWCPPEVWRRVEGWVDELAREQGAAVLNARLWIDEEQQFLDSHHLLSGGARLYTQRLGRDAVLPLLRARGRLVVSGPAKE
jgi:hypothetical protein